MIARHEAQLDKMDVWAKLSAPLPAGVISWRQDGRPIQRDGKFLARFVSYVDANTVRERLDMVVPGEWDLTLELLPPGPQEVDSPEPALVSFKARLQILGVIREDIGQGRDYKSASTDAFKRSAVRFGIAHELYAMGQNWVQVDGDGRYAKPLEDPQAAYDRRYGAQAPATRPNAAGPAPRPSSGAPAAAAPAGPSSSAPAASTRAGSREERSEEERYGSQLSIPGQPHGHEAVRRTVPAARRAPEEGDVIPDGTGDPKVVGEPACPKCGSRMWDNRATKRNPKAPDYKCRDRSCDGVIWPPRENETPGAQRQPRRGPTGGKVSEALEPVGGKQPEAEFEDFPGALEDEDDDLPF